MSDIYIDLTDRVNELSTKYWKLVKALATVEKDRDEILGKYNGLLEEHNKTLKKYNESLRRNNKTIKEHKDEFEWLRKELREEHRLRVDAEYDKEYYAMRLMEHMD